MIKIKQIIILVSFLVIMVWLYVSCSPAIAGQMSRSALAEEGARQLVASKLVPEPFNELSIDDFKVRILEVEGQKHLLYVEVRNYKWLVVLETQEKPQGVSWCKWNACVQIIGKVTPFKQSVVKAINAWPGYKTQWLTKD